MSRRRNAQEGMAQRPALFPAAPGRADFFLAPAKRHLLLTPASTRGAWFLTATPLADPPRLIPRIGPAHLLRFDIAAALLPQLAEHFRFRVCAIRRELARPSPGAER